MVTNGLKFYSNDISLNLGRLKNKFLVTKIYISDKRLTMKAELETISERIGFSRGRH